MRRRDKHAPNTLDNYLMLHDKHLREREHFIVENGIVISRIFSAKRLRIVGGGRYPACAAFLRKLRQTFGDMGVRQFMVSNVSGSVPTATPAANT